jgi:hypothetical protein
MGEESERIRDKTVVESNSLAPGSSAGSAFAANPARNRTDASNPRRNARLKELFLSRLEMHSVLCFV